MIRYFVTLCSIFVATSFPLADASAQTKPAETPQPVEETPAAEETPIYEEVRLQMPEEEEEEPKFSLHGYIQSQAGIFVSDETDDIECTEPTKPLTCYPSNHGDKLGELSMMRNVLLLEADWKPFPWVSVHAMFRGALSLRLDADRDAQVPEPNYSRYDDDWEDRRIGWVHKKYYNEGQLREFFVDIEPTSWLYFRAGRQQVTWGETGQYRLLDVINPVNTTWHFGPLESFEDTRIPLWMLKTIIEIEPLQGNLELIWIPMLDTPSETVTTPLTFVGAWGLPPAPRQTDESLAEAKIREKVFRYPDQDIRNSRGGVRWSGLIGNLNYSLVYFYNHQLSPPIPQYYIAQTGVGNTVFVDFPRQHIAGFSLEYALEYPAGTILKLEAAIEPDRTYPRYSLAKGDPEVLPSGDAKVPLLSVQKKVLSYAVTVMQPGFIRWLNPEQTFLFVIQFMHTAILDFDGGEHIQDIPGYDSTAVKQHAFKVIFAMGTRYLKGMIAPRLVAAWLVNSGGKESLEASSGFISAQVGFIFGNHWRMKLAASFFMGGDPYKGAGMFRDRDEINLSIRYQF